MRKSKFSETQIVGILKDAEAGVAVNALLRTHGISRATFFTWRSKYGGARVSDVTRLRELEAENAKLKRMYADLALENAAIKDVLARKLQGRPRSDRGPPCWSVITGCRCGGPVGGELLLSPQSVEIIKFGDPGRGR